MSSIRATVSPAYSAPASTCESGRSCVTLYGVKNGRPARWAGGEPGSWQPAQRPADAIQHPDADRTMLTVTQPAAGGGIGQDPVRCRPAEAEQLGEKGLPSLHELRLVARMRPALLGHEEAGPEHRRGRTRIDRVAHVGGVGEAAGDQHRVGGWELSANAFEQLARGEPSSRVAARLDALSDDRVGAGGVCRACLSDRATLVDPDTRSPAGAGGPSASRSRQRWRQPSSDACPPAAGLG